MTCSSHFIFELLQLLDVSAVEGNGAVLAALLFSIFFSLKEGSTANKKKIKKIYFAVNQKKKKKKKKKKRTGYVHKFGLFYYMNKVFLG